MNAICTHICKACYAMTVCAVHAIGERTDAVVLDPKKCIGCGCCMTACKTFGHSMIKHKTVKAERVRPLPGAPTSPWPEESEGE